MARVTILDGPIGTELARRGVDITGPAWSARAIDGAPEVLAAIHADYAAAGASVHTAATFRTQPRVSADWERLAREAVRIARGALPRGALVAGSIAPLADCYRPDLSPADEDPAGTRADHLALARVLADAGCDVLLCETFAHAGEALLAAGAAVGGAGATGAEVWLSLSPGFAGDLLSPGEVAGAGASAARLGVGAVLVNCAPVEATGAYVGALAGAVAGRGVAVGAYANAGRAGGAWRTGQAAIGEYVRAAETWSFAGARIIGSCCGTGPDFTRALTDRFHRPG